MIRTVLAAFAMATAAVPTLAAAEEPATFTRDGVHYTYVSTTEGEHTVLRGKVDGRYPFTLKVRGRRVTGTYDRSPVDFLLPKAYKGGVVTTVAAR